MSDSLDPRLREQILLDRWRRSGSGQEPLKGIMDKLKRADQIADEALQRHNGRHNDEGDAQRHAEWSMQMAEELGPRLAGLIGLGHELTGSLPRIRRDGEYKIGNQTFQTYGVYAQPVSEFIMDMRNNSEGIRAARERRPIDPKRLQTAPEALAPLRVGRRSR